MATTEPINFLRLNVLKKKTRIALSTFSCFYNSSWLTNIDRFLKAIANFAEIIADSYTIDFFFQQLIVSVVTSAVAIAVASIQAKHKSKMLSLREMIKKSLLLRNSPSATPLPDPDAASKAHSGADLLPKSTTKRWNQADLSYFDLHLKRAHRKGKIVLLGKNVYYKNVVLFMQRL